MNTRLTAKGHLIDSGIMSQIFNMIVAEGADYEVRHFEIGKTPDMESVMELDLICEDPALRHELSQKLTRLGCYEPAAEVASWGTAPKDKCVPEDFYSTTNHRSEVFVDGKWLPVAKQRMDGVIIKLADGTLECRKLRDVKAGETVLIGGESVRVFPPSLGRSTDDFGFMSNEVSSERAGNVSVDAIANEIKDIMDKGGKIVAVAGPVIIHTGGAEALAGLVKEGYIHGILSGNALAVHDVESEFFGTSLGISMKSGKPTHEGHKNHMMAINKINYYGSIRGAIDAGALTGGLMYEIEEKGIPYCLAGSIRDDGPLPETVTDMIEAQAQYADIIKDASMVIMLSSMLHSIGTGNMLPSWVKTVCVDINPAVVTKLSDRGSSQTVGIVSDVGFFLRGLLEKLRSNK